MPGSAPDLPQFPRRALQPAFTVVELAHPDLGPGERRQRGDDDGKAVPAVPGGHRDRLLTASAGQAEGVDGGGETEVREAGDLQVGPLDGAGKGGALREVTFAVGKPQQPRLRDTEIEQRVGAQIAAEGDVGAGTAGRGRRHRARQLEHAVEMAAQPRQLQFEGSDRHGEAAVAVRRR